MAGEVSSAEAARALRLTAQAVGQWAKRSGAPVRIDGTHVWIKDPAFFRWREEELCRQAVAGKKKEIERSQPTDGKDANPVARKLEADARKAEIEVELLERSVIRVTDADAAAVSLLTDLRAKLIPFPRTASPKLVGAKTIQELEQRLDVEVQRLMELLATPHEFADMELDEAA